MKILVPLAILFQVIGMSAQDSSGVRVPYLHGSGLFAGATWSILQIEPSADPSLADSLGIVLTTESGPGMIAGMYYSHPISGGSLRYSLAAEMNPARLIYDSGRPVTEKFSVHPFSVQVAAHYRYAKKGDPGYWISEGRSSHSRWSPLAGISSNFAFPGFNGGHPELHLWSISAEAGLGYNGTLHKMNMHVDLVFSQGVTDLLKSVTDHYGALAGHVYRQTLSLRFYFQ